MSFLFECALHDDNTTDRCNQKVNKREDRSFVACNDWHVPCIKQKQELLSIDINLSPAFCS